MAYKNYFSKYILMLIISASCCVRHSGLHEGIFQAGSRFEFWNSE